MLNILIHGINGAMGQHVYELVQSQHVIGFDHQPHPTVTTYSDFSFSEKIDVIIDFSHFTMIDDLLDYAENNKVPVVLCTTGLTDETEKRILQVAQTVPIFKSGNMSLGINVLIELAKIGARSLDNFDIEIIEKHHNQKIDAPSGTAYMIADAIQSIKNYDYVYGREGHTGKRDKETIGIHAIRGGSITGEHTVIYAGLDETIELKHQATSKRVFAKGAVEAANYIINKKPRLYNMSDMLGGLS